MISNMVPGAFQGKSCLLPGLLQTAHVCSRAAGAETVSTDCLLDCELIANSSATIHWYHCTLTDVFGIHGSVPRALSQS